MCEIEIRYNNKSKPDKTAAWNSCQGVGKGVQRSVYNLLAIILHRHMNYMEQPKTERNA